MAPLISLIIYTVWCFVGYSFLEVLNIGTFRVRALASSAMGIAILELITANASLVGIPASGAKWIVFCLLGFLCYLFYRGYIKGFIKALLINSSFLGLSLVVVGMGLFLFGLDWQGMLNDDASTNALAAQYFLNHSFFSDPSVLGVASGLDYSALSTKLYVAGGHRFGDVMLLSLSAAIFNLNPDQIYMSHALAIRTALLSVSILLVAMVDLRIWKLLLPVILLSISPLFSYTYFNQLISQTGGMALVICSAIFLELLIQQRSYVKKYLFALSISIASLCQYYPESVSLLILSGSIFVLYKFYCRELPPIIVLIKWITIVVCIVGILLNLSLPNILNHIRGILGWGSVKVKALEPFDSDFNYAFTPDFFPIILGFESLYEVVSDPWAFVIQVCSAAFLLSILYFGFRRVRQYPLLFSFSSASLLIFIFLFLQGNRFGTFKMMLLVQPFLYNIISILFIEVISASLLFGALLILPFLILVIRVEINDVAKSLNPFTFLNQIHFLLEKTRDGAIFTAPSFLSGKFSVLREKSKPLFFDQNFPGFYGGADGRTNRGEADLKIKRNIFLPDQDRFKEKLNGYYEKNYRTEAFSCGDIHLAPKFESFIRSELNSALPHIVPGGGLIPLNGLSNQSKDFLLLNNEEKRDYLVLRPSSLSEYYGVADTVGIYRLESDPFGGRGIAAVGRYLLLEILSPTQKMVRLTMNFSRTYLGGDNSEIPNIVIHGASSVPIGAEGGGSFQLTSPYVEPCNIDGRSYLLVDFGVKSEKRNTPPPLAYKLLSTPYVPDRRRITGYLRDISLAKPNGSSNNKIEKTLDGSPQQKILSNVEYSGYYEDGWLSHNVLLKPTALAGNENLYLEIDIPAELGESGATLEVKVNHLVVKKLPLASGLLNLNLGVIKPNSSIELAIDKPYRLPGMDGRMVMGFLRQMKWGQDDHR